MHNSSIYHSAPLQTIAAGTMLWLCKTTKETGKLPQSTAVVNLSLLYVSNHLKFHTTAGDART
eukprot:1159284-Pelagomonas_calceolata.AAC.9